MALKEILGLRCLVTRAPGPATYFCFLRLIQEGPLTGTGEHMPNVLVNHLGGLNLFMKSVVRLTEHPDMTIAVYRGT